MFKGLIMTSVQVCKSQENYDQRTRSTCQCNQRDSKCIAQGWGLCWMVYVQIYNCTNVLPLSLASNAIAPCVCKTCPGNQDTVRQNSPPSTDVNHSLWLCCTLPCASIIVGINRCWASMFCFCQLWCCEMRYCCGSSSCARVNCNLRSTRGNLCTRIIARALHLLVHRALS